jgi:hypothetical protein
MVTCLDRHCELNWILFGVRPNFQRILVVGFQPQIIGSGYRIRCQLDATGGFMSRSIIPCGLGPSSMLKAASFRCVMVQSRLTLSGRHTPSDDILFLVNHTPTSGQVAHRVTREIMLFAGGFQLDVFSGAPYLTLALA